MDKLESLPKVLKYFISIKGYTPTSISRLSGVPIQTIHNWLHGKSPRDLKAVQKVCKVLDISIDEALGGTKSPIEPTSSQELKILIQILESLSASFNDFLFSYKQSAKLRSEYVKLQMELKESDYFLKKLKKEINQQSNITDERS